jgi:DNA polymerase-1
LFLANYYVNTTVDGNSEPIGGFVGFIAQLQKLIVKFTPQKVVIIFDGPSAGLRRRTLYKDYKGKRPIKSRFVDVQINEEWKEKVSNEQEQLKMLFDFLKHLPVQLLIIPYYEADDVIAYLVRKNPQYFSIISSSDKDYLQLVDKNTVVYSTTKKTLFDEELVREKYKVSPKNYLYLRTITSDDSDNLKGVKGVGDKTVFKALTEITERDFTDFNDFYTSIEKLPKGSVLVEKLREGREQAKLMYKLMCLTDHPLNLKAIDHLVQQLKDQENKVFSKMLLKTATIHEGTFQYLKDFDNWVRPFVFLDMSLNLEA